MVLLSTQRQLKQADQHRKATQVHLEQHHPLVMTVNTRLTLKEVLHKEVLRQEVLQMLQRTRLRMWETLRRSLSIMQAMRNRQQVNLVLTQPRSFYASKMDLHLF